MSGLIVFVFCFAVLGLFVWLGVKAARRQADEWIEQEVQKVSAAQTLARKRAVALRAYQADYDTRYASGVRLNLSQDKRRELYGSARYLPQGVPAQRYSIRKDVRAWCKDNLQSEWCMLPFSEEQSSEAIMWFEDPNEAMWFKMQWY